MFFSKVTVNPNSTGRIHLIENDQIVGVIDSSQVATYFLNRDLGPNHKISMVMKNSHIILEIYSTPEVCQTFMNIVQ